MVVFGNVRYVKPRTIEKIILFIMSEIATLELPGKENLQIRLEVAHQSGREQTF